MNRQNIPPILLQIGGDIMINYLSNLIENYKMKKAYIKMMNAENKISETELLEICRNGQNIQNI